MKKRLTALLLSLVLVAGLIWAGFAYIGFVSQTIYEESTSHLTEIFHQAIISLRFFNGIQIFTLDIFNQRDFTDFRIVVFAYHRWYGL